MGKRRLDSWADKRSCMPERQHRRGVEQTHMCGVSFESDLRCTLRIVLQSWARWSDLTRLLPSGRVKTKCESGLATSWPRSRYISSKSASCSGRQTSRICAFHLHNCLAEVSDEKDSHSGAVSPDTL